jgi:hypothetical protein
MQPVCVKKAGPEDRNIWMDTFVALEPAGGFRAVVEGTQHSSGSKHLAAIFSLLPAPVRHRPAPFGRARQRVRS